MYKGSILFHLRETDGCVNRKRFIVQNKSAKKKTEQLHINQLILSVCFDKKRKIWTQYGLVRLWMIKTNLSSL